MPMWVPAMEEAITTPISKERPVMWCVANQSAEPQLCCSLAAPLLANIVTRGAIYMPELENQLLATC